ncbi:hypothetical protein AtNW77_Chr1g0057101 [Arabidopsis thaliana]
MWSQLTSIGQFFCLYKALQSQPLKTYDKVQVAEDDGKAYHFLVQHLALLYSNISRYVLGRDNSFFTL